jgi:hypothetical protein
VPDSYDPGTFIIRQLPKFMTTNNTAKATHIQMGSPAKVCRFGFGGDGLGNSDWQRQHTSLSSGFQVPHSGQFIFPPLLDWLRHSSIEKAAKQKIGPSTQ